MQHRERAEARAHADANAVRHALRDLRQQLAHERTRVQRGGGVRLVAVDRLDQRSAQRWDALLPAHRVEVAGESRVLGVLGAVVDDERAARRRRAARASSRGGRARARRAGGSAARAPRPGPASAIVSSQSGAAYSGHSTTDLSPNGPAARSGLAGSGPKSPSIAEQVLHAVGVRARERRAATRRPPTRTAARAAGARPPARAPRSPKRCPGSGTRELHRVLADARRGQRFFFFGRFARARILYSRTRSCRSRWFRRASTASSSR